MRPEEPPPAGGQEPFYFFLSHAHPQPVDPHVEIDYYVRAVFRDLSDAVTNRPRGKADWSVGLFRPCADPSVEPDRVDRALASTAVFVALRSTCYDADEQATVERLAFYRQPSTLHERPPQQRLLPVLWEVPPTATAWATLDTALTPLPDVPQYAETGLVALSRRHADRDAYERVLAFLSEWIVDVAEGRQVPASGRWPGTAPRKAKPAFMIATWGVPAAGDGGGTAGGVRTDGPLRQAAARVAGYVNTARFDVRSVDLSDGNERLGERPAVLLIDAATLEADGDRRTRLKELLRTLPAWVQPLLVPESIDDIRPPEADLWDGRRTPAGGPRWVPRPRIMTELNDSAAVITAAIDRAIRNFDDEHLVERRYPPRPRSNSQPEE
ncbi:hypothetical protein ACFOOK_14775 [Micromonospora krabiensis]|uniref:FxsC C-terminal domain-containing protein n=1 Tax=Micromonospora krabiensis TaxID=307121 RepID=A0A1C3N140_9ACTN|nr:hypothetical protein [Micromonospora krabiensis]SBV26299.1 hypothetical protein GA0070620_1786 [Micromonospora krabiensis]